MNALRIVSVCLWVLASVHTITGAATTEKMLIQKKAYAGYCNRNNNQADSTQYSPDGVGYMNTYYDLTGQENSPAERLKCHEHCISTYNDKFYQILVYTSGTHEGKCYCSIPFSSNCDSNMADETASETWVFVDAYRVVQSDRTKPLNAKPFNPPGIGQDFKVGVSVEEQDSELGGGEPFGYGKPSISNVNLDVINTDGSAQISLSGENFGLNVKSVEDPSVYYTTVYGETTQTPVFNIQTYKRDSSVEVDVNTGSLLFRAPPLDQLPPGKAGTHSIYLVVGVAIQPVGGQQILAKKFLAFTIIFVLYVCVSATVNQQRRLAHAMEQRFVEPAFAPSSSDGFGLLKFQDIRNFEDMWAWTDQILLPGIYDETMNSLDNNNGDPFDDQVVIDDASNILFGIRFRQVRMSRAKTGCDIPLKIVKSGITGGKTSCVAEYSQEFVDRAMFGVPTVSSSLRFDGSQTNQTIYPYKWFPSSDTQEPEYRGALQSYYGGGYVVDIPLNRSKAFDQVNEMRYGRVKGSKNLATKDTNLDEIVPNSMFVDPEVTRALFASFGMYHLGLNLHMTCQFVFEWHPGGQMVPSIQFTGTRLFFPFTVHRVIEVVLNVLLNLGIGYYWVQLLMDFRAGLLPHMDAARQGQQFVGANMVLCAIRGLRYLQVFDSLRVILRAITNTAADVANFLVMLLIMVFAFAMGGFFIFGPHISGFETIGVHNQTSMIPGFEQHGP
eukprot:g6161.t1